MGTRKFHCRLIINKKKILQKLKNVQNYKIKTKSIALVLYYNIILTERLLSPSRIVFINNFKIIFSK